MSTPILVELHVSDFDIVKEFYGVLGFSFEQKDEQYLVARKNELVLCFYGGDESVDNHSYFKKFEGKNKGNGVEIIIPVQDVHSFFEEVKDKIEIVESLQKRHWGATDFRVADPFGYYLRITGEHEK